VAGRGRIAAAALVILAGGARALPAQDLAPRAYVIAPLGSNALTLGYTYNTGELLFEGTVPITDSTGRLSTPYAAYYRSFSLGGRSANVLAVLPYGVGTFEGKVLGAERSVYRSGLFDVSVRASVNLLGGPAMTLPEIRTRKWRQKTLLGVSLKIIAPTGQYDPTKLINLGSNRWTFKPELGFSQAFGHWLLDAYASGWFFTKNPEFFSRNEYVGEGTFVQTQDPIWATELHVSYDVRPRFWVSLDGNFWYGGRTSLNGIENPKTLQKNSRIGLTASVPLTRHQSMKLSYARGAYIRFGGDYQIYSIGWQYSWISGLKPPPPKEP
jgi:Putative MetA-pathway of phenol degradation